MSPTEDLIDFDIIETHKENIQPLASGRSAKALVSTFAPSSGISGPTPGDTRNLNDAIREEYELEIKSIQDSDDPLDVYDRYVKWTLSAYPSAQATSDSQLRPLLERATKTFQSVTHYKNDPRYLRLWLHYIRWFSDAPRETFTYLSRHGIGESLALFYEEFAAWLEGAGRWKQADEVYQLAVDREARPTERLVRKFGEFKHRFEARAVNTVEPSSPALPTVRPALAAKVDPFAASTPQPSESQAARSSVQGRPSIVNTGRTKLAIFSDADGSTPSSQLRSGSKNGGWHSIGTAQDRKKENVVEPKPWTGETLGGGKRLNGPPKMAVFKDESKSHDVHSKEKLVHAQACHTQVQRSISYKVEQTFVDTHAIYPQGTDRLDCEMSIEELRAKARGWLDRKWVTQERQGLVRRRDGSSSGSVCVTDAEGSSQIFNSVTNRDSPTTSSSPKLQLETTIAMNTGQGEKEARPKRPKIKEVKGETQTGKKLYPLLPEEALNCIVKTNLESPAGPKLRRKASSEPTMTLHTRAATDDILDIFNQPLRSVDPMAGPAETDDETDFDDDDDDYTSVGESPGTGKIFGTSDFEDTEPNEKTTTCSEGVTESVSPWSEFTASRHVPGGQRDEHGTEGSSDIVELALSRTDAHREAPATENLETAEAGGFPSTQGRYELIHPNHIPHPPQYNEPPAKCHRDLSSLAQSRLPFMTPILEKTETSLGAASVQSDYFSSKTPLRHKTSSYATPCVDIEALSSPFQELLEESRCRERTKLQPSKRKSEERSEVNTNVPLIKDHQCNPVDDSIRQSILDNCRPSLDSHKGFHDHREETFNKGHDIRKFVKSLSKSKLSDRAAPIALPPVIQFRDDPNKTYTIRRELGKGAFAPVYLAAEQSEDQSEDLATLMAIKSEDPPTAWEFHMMTLLHTRLSSNHRASSSILRPLSLHLYKDEGYLLEEYIDQGTLLDLVNLARSDTLSGQTTLDESIAMFFTIELLRTVEAMHSVGILHGDLKADNCLIRLPAMSSKEQEWDTQYNPDGSHGWSMKGLTLIDFGRSIDVTVFQPNVQFIADWKTGKQDCIEMRELRPWTYQVDYFGIAGVVHSLLFGKYIDDMVIENRDGGSLGGRKKYRIREGLKRYWQTDLWARLFDLSLNPLDHIEAEDSRTMPCTKAFKTIREEMEQWLVGEGGRRNGGLRTGLLRLQGRVKERKGR